MSIAGNIAQLKNTLPEGVTLVAVSKFHPADDIQEAYNAGQRVFGESRAQELKGKQAVLPADIEWHFIGPLQSNKVKDIAPFIHLIHSIDSFKLLQEVNKQAIRFERVIDVLIEVHIAEEDSKHGFSMDECRELLQSGTLNTLSNIRVRGLMGMATFTDNTDQVRYEFHRLHDLFVELKSPTFTILSMGMSDDYLTAIEEGSTMVRIGSRIFGERTY